MTRRYFARALAALLAAGAALPTLLFWWRSSTGPSETAETWIDLGTARKIPEGEWQTMRFSFERRNRWRVELAEEVAYVWRVERDIKVLSATCPHARCLIRTDEAGFSCSCHSSSFSREGEALTGPSPRSMDPMEWKVRKGRLLIKYTNFRPGVAQREALQG
jgi:nitrite reductase/ring-hydroxylating ferredoxin subunit